VQKYLRIAQIWFIKGVMSVQVRKQVTSGEFVAVGAKIRNIRQMRKLTLQQVAAEVGTDTGNLSRMERGKQGIGLMMMSKLAEALNVRPDLFWRETDDEGAFQQMSLMAERFPGADYSLEPSNRTGYKLTDVEAQLINDFRDLAEDQAKQLARQVHEQAQQMRTKRLLADERAVRYINDPRVQALLADIEQKDKK
jgi:transcriptional regulator with XRE-family HTH domain